jgi:hypothetical protein
MIYFYVHFFGGGSVTAITNRKYKEVRKHQHKRAVVLTARKLVRIVVRLLTTFLRR